jgi:hypothetical protein
MNSPRILLSAALVTGSVAAAHADSLYIWNDKTLVPQSFPVGKSKDGRVRVAQADVSGTVSTSEGEAIHKVISDYYNAFGRDTAAAAAFYGEPTLIVLPSQVMMLNERADVEAFLGKLVATLKPRGYSGSKLEAPRIKLLNVTTAL